MKILKTVAILAAVAALCGCASAPKSELLANTSFESGKLLFDNNGRIVNAHGAGFLYFDGRYYMFGEHKLGGDLGNRALVGIHCYSSSDLYNWRDEGIALEMSADPNSEIVMGTVLERPKVVFNQKTGKFVMLFHLEARKGATAKSTDIETIRREKPNYSAAKIGFAISDSVAGPYKYLRSQRINAGKYPLGEKDRLVALRNKLDAEVPNWRTAKRPKAKQLDGEKFLVDFDGGQMSRDMTVFVDDDKKAYVFTASENNSTLQIHELSDDYLDFTGKFVRAFFGGHHEAPAVFKKDGKYFMFSSHCTGWSPNPGRISSADSPLGEWRELGNPCRGEGQKASRTYPEVKADTTFRSQSTYVIPVVGKKDAFIYVGDRWLPDDAIDGRYIFLPIEWENSSPIVRWYNSWDLSFFK